MEKWQSNNLESLIELVDKTINLIEEKNLESDFDKEIKDLGREGRMQLFKIIVQESEKKS